MKLFSAGIAFCAVVLSIFVSSAWAADCPCLDMSGSGCTPWSSSGADFYWITSSDPSSSVTLTTGPCGGSGESATGYVVAHVDASSDFCDDDWDTPCDGETTPYARYAKIKVSGNQEAFIMPAV